MDPNPSSLSFKWPSDEGELSGPLSNDQSSKDFDMHQFSMIPPTMDVTTTTSTSTSRLAHHNNTTSNDNNLIHHKKYMVEESTFIRPDSLKSSSMLRLADILSQNILLHPFVALRRTCQVNRKCSPFICVQPFSLMSFMYHQQRKQGISALYKGLSSELLVKGMTLGTVTALANYAEWPTEVNSKRYIEDSIKVVILRGLSIALSTPFLCSSVIETIQSVIVVKDRPAFIDCLKEGFFRLLQLRSTPSSRIIPIWLLVLPTVTYHVAHFIVKNVAENFVDLFRSSVLTVSSSKKRRIYPKYNHTNIQTNPKSFIEQQQQQDLTINNYDSFDSSCIENCNNFELDSTKISTSILAGLIADVTLLPVETILNSLYIQGTRTIIDNCDETTVVLPVLTNYDGFSDCYQSILRFEGNLGLYKGLGAIILQYSVHFLLFRSLYYLLREFQFNGNGSRGNAHHQQERNTMNSTTRSMLQTTRLNNNNNDKEFVPYMQNTRHSTPNNPIPPNRLRLHENYRLDGTPNDLIRVQAMTASRKK